MYTGILTFVILRFSRAVGAKGSGTPLCRPRAGGKIWRKTKVVLVKVISWIIYYFHIRIYICVMKLMLCVYK